MTEPWDVLGVGPTEDIREIKKAYAARLKLCHPEDDAKGFQELREAYEWAVGYARWRTDNPQEEDDDGLSPELIGPDQDAPAHERAPPGPHPSAQESTPSAGEGPAQAFEHEDQAAIDLMRRVERLRVARDLWTSEDAWKGLLESEALWSVDTRDAFQGRLIAFLAENGAGVPAAVWSVLDDEFSWSEQRWSLYRTLDPEMVDEVVNYVDYLATIEKAERHFAAGDYQEAGRELDPIVRTLGGPLATRAALTLARCFLEVDAQDNAEQLLKELIAAQRDCVPAHLLVARVFRMSGRHSLALGAYARARELSPGNPEIAEQYKRAREALERDRGQDAARLDTRETGEFVEWLSSPPPSPEEEVPPVVEVPGHALHWALRLLWFALVVTFSSSRLFEVPVGEWVRSPFFPWAVAFIGIAVALVSWRHRRGRPLGLGLDDEADRLSPEMDRVPAASPTQGTSVVPKRLVIAILVALGVLLGIALFW